MGGRGVLRWTLLGIVDDLEVCCSYNWAETSFEKNIWSLKRALDKKVKNGGLRKTYSLYGFPWAFQVQFSMWFMFSFSFVIHYVPFV